MFAHIDGLIVVGGDMVLFRVRYCEVVYFDAHYHAYVVNCKSHQSLSLCNKLVDRSVYHGHKLPNGLDYITLKYRFV